MKLPETIKVTGEHIAKGTPGNMCMCPVALAVLAAWPARDVLVEVTSDSGGEIWVTPRSGDLFVTDWTDEIHGFVRAFDAGRPVDPFEFSATWRTVTP